jgi:hypothetical protein
MGNHAIAAVKEKQHLRVPVVGRQRPAVAEDDGLTFASVFVKNFDAIFGFDEHDAPFRDRAIAERPNPAAILYPSAQKRGGETVVLFWAFADLA